MVFKKNFALAVRSNGKILREINDQVFIPFGSEYELVLKNLNSIRAQVRIWIDGSQVTSGVSLIVPPNDTVVLERSVSTGNLRAGNKFKFIEKTAKIEQYRGNKIDDGIIRIEYQFEKKYDPIPRPQPTWIKPEPMWQHPQYYDDRFYCADPSQLSSVMDSNVTDVSYSSKAVLRNTALGKTPKSSSIACNAVNTAGITVPGSESNQQFSTSYGFLVESEVNVLSLQLVGEVAGQEVVQPITVKTKQECPTCGKKNKINSKFCVECGTNLCLFNK